jgi:hypothetical protein
MPVVGKVIQPQPRNAVAPSVDLSAASSKHAWGAARAGMPAGQSADPEFPTAAEVAQGKQVVTPDNNTNNALISRS